MMVEQNPAIDPADLDLIGQDVADSVKEDAEIWAELEAAEKGKAEPEAVTDVAEKAAPEADNTDAPAQEQDAASPQGTAAPDIWANAPPELKAAYDALAADKSKLEHRIRSDEGRVSALNRRVDELRKTLQQTQPGADATNKAKTARENLAGMAEEYPEIVAPLREVIDTIDGRVNELSAAETGRRQAAEDELADIVETETAKLAERHPDWSEILNKHGGPAFAAWVEDQPRRIRDAFVRNGNAIVDSEGAIALIEAYKAHLTPPQQAAPTGPTPTNPPNQSLNERRERQLAGAASPTKSGRRPTISGVPEDGDPQAIWDAFEAQDRARQQAARR